MSKFVPRYVVRGCLIAVLVCNALLSVSPAAALSPKGKHLVVIRLEGGADSLYITQPDESNFSLNLQLNIKRPNVFLTEASNDLLRLGTSGIGVNADMSVLLDCYSSDLALIFGVGVDNPTLNHELADQVMAGGVTDVNTSFDQGWIQRLMAAAKISDPLAVLDFAGGHFSTTGGTSSGSRRPLVFTSFSNYISLRGGGEQQLSPESFFRLDTLGLAMQQNTDLKGPALGVRNQIADFITYYDDVSQGFNSLPGGYSGNTFAQQMRQIDGIINDPEAEGRATISFLTMGGFDTHDRQVQRMSGPLLQLNDALSDFRTSMMTQSQWENVAVLIYSEFGRTIAENGMEGTDHAPTQIVYMIGGAVRGGFYGSKPTTTDINNATGFLPRQYNWVDVLYAVVTGLGYDAAAVFPGVSVKSLNLIQ